MIFLSFVQSLEKKFLYPFQGEFKNLYLKIFGYHSLSKQKRYGLECCKYLLLQALNRQRTSHWLCKNSYHLIFIFAKNYFRGQNLISWKFLLELNNFDGLWNSFYLAVPMNKGAINWFFPRRTASKIISKWKFPKATYLNYFGPMFSGGMNWEYLLEMVSKQLKHCWL